MGFPHPHRAVQDHRLAGLHETKGGQVADLSSWHLGVEGEIELLQGGGRLEASGPDPASKGGGIASRHLVLAQNLQELQMSQLAGMGLGQAGLEGVEHP